MSDVSGQAGNYTGYWYYQLSYDKNNMVGMNGQLQNGEFEVRNGGSGYTSGTTCNLVIGGGGTASGKAVIGQTGSVTKVIILNQGYGYTTEPTATLHSDCGAGTGAQLGTVPISSVPGYPKNLWETDLLSVYFSDSTINSMRQYYCQNSLKQDITGKTTDPKCWGYMSVSINNYKFNPMTIKGRA
jgi:hypothetical protein